MMNTAVNVQPEEMWQVLNNLSGDLLDIYQAYQEVPISNPPLNFTSQFKVSEENWDAFDWSSMHYEFDQVSLQDAVPEKVDWDELFRSIETTVAKGCLWETDASEYRPTLQYGANVLRRSAAYYKGDTQDMGLLLRQLDRLPANNVDILSTDDSVFEKSYYVVSNFEMKVPLEIYGQGEDLIIKADIPDILFNSLNASDMKLPEQINFKNVLALLPERINTRQLRPTFIDGQFRLELPKREEKRAKKIF